MGDELLSVMLKDKVRAEGLSVRAAARQIGIAHTSLGRIMRGENMDLGTAAKIASWLGVNVSEIVDAPSTGDLSTRMAVIIQSVPELEEVFETALSRLEKGEVSYDAVRDLVRYAAFRFSLEAKDE